MPHDGPCACFQARHVSERAPNQAGRVAGVTHQHSGMTGLRPDILKDFVIGRMMGGETKKRIES